MRPRRRRKNTAWKKLYKKINYFAKKNSLYLMLCFFLFTITGFVFYGYSKYIDTPEKTIRETLFAKKHIENLNINGLLEYTEDVFSGKNILELEYLTFDAIREEMLSKYYFLEDVSFKEESSSKVFVDFQLREPLFVFSGVSNDYVIYNKENIFDLQKGNSLFLSGNDIVELANFATGNIEGIFYKTSPETIDFFTSTIKEQIDKDAEFTFIPGGERLLVVADGKEMYFDLKKKLELQLENYFIVSTAKPDLYENSYLLDLSSLSDGVYMHIIEEEEE